MMILGLLGTLVYFFMLGMEARSDGKRGDRTHLLDWVIRALVGTAVSIIMLYNQGILSVIAYCFVLMFTSWPFFNITYNYYSKRKSLFYVGKTAESDKWFRKKFPWHYEEAMILTWLIGIISSLVFFIWSL